MNPKFWKFFSTTKITSVAQACKILETQKQGVPFGAIEYLREQPASKKLERQIVFAIAHAYSDIYYDSTNEHWSDAPLWYAIVAEEHLSKQLIDPIISLYTTTNNDGDLLNEQGMYVLGQLAKQYGDEVVEKVVWNIDKMIEVKSDFAFLFLFDALYYADIEKYKSWFLETMQKDFNWRDMFIQHIADLQIKEAAPIIKNLLDKIDDEMEANELNEALEILEKGRDSSLLSGPYCEKRDDWGKHYKRHEHVFYDDEKEKAGEESAYLKKNGRNDPCPCGSGRKWKKCCGGG